MVSGIVVGVLSLVVAFTMGWRTVNNPLRVPGLARFLRLMFAWPLLPMAVEAQGTDARVDPVAVTVGSRGRLSMGPEVLKGLVLAISDTSVTVVGEKSEAAPLVLRRATIERIEVSVKRRSHWKRGMLIGAVGNGIAFAFSTEGPGVCERSPDDLLCGDTGERALAGALAGVGFGALIGNFFKYDVWFAASF